MTSQLHYLNLVRATKKEKEILQAIKQILSIYDDYFVFYHLYSSWNLSALKELEEAFLLQCSDTDLNILMPPASAVTTQLSQWLSELTILMPRFSAVEYSIPVQGQHGKKTS